MCGRYNFTAEENVELREIVEQIGRKYAQADWHEGEIYPTNNVGSAGRASTGSPPT